MTTLHGKKGEYSLTDQLPFKFGPNSLIFRGSDSSGSAVCIKIYEIDPKVENRDRTAKAFEKEIHFRQTLHHPNILPILDFGLTSGTSDPFLALPLCEGGNLKDYMAGKNYVPFQTAIDILEQIGSAIDYTHRKGVIHGDVKPENVLFSADFSSVYLTDFGVAKHFPAKDATVVMGTGTLAYLSPEQIQYNKITPLSDIYSFSLVAFKLLTGGLPFDSRSTLFDQMKAKVNGELEDAISRNPRISQIANSAIMAGLSAEQKNRPASASALCELLKGDLNSAVIGTSPVIDREQKNGFWKALKPENKVAIIAATIAAVAGIIVAILELIPNLLEKTP